MGFFFKKNTITHLICRLVLFWEHKGGVGPRGGTLIFSYIRRLGQFFGVQNF